MKKSVLFALGLQSVEGVKVSKCPFGYGGDEKDSLVQTGDDDPVLDPSIDFSKYNFLTDVPGFEQDGAITEAVKAKDDALYKKIAEDVWVGYGALEEAKSKEAFAGCLLRTAGHDFMDFRYLEDGSSTGGSDGCINFHDPDNKGVAECLTRFGVGPHAY